MRETEASLWHRLLGGLPKGTLVKVKDRRFSKGYYYGIVQEFAQITYKKTRYFYIINQYPVRHGCSMWVKPDSILEVVEKS